MTTIQNAAEVKNSNLPENTMEQISKTTKTVYVGCKRIPYEVKDNEVYDERTFHLLREVDGQTIEMKLCTRCRQWHPLYDFYKDRSREDGLTSSCKYCMSSKPYNDNMERLNNVDPDTAARMGKGIQSFIDWLSSHDKEMSEKLQSMKEVIKEQGEQISRLQRIIKDREDTIKEQKKEIAELDAELSAPLTEEDIKIVLNADFVQPRMLFSALKGKDKTHIFYYKDTTTGAFRPVVAE